VPGLADVRSGFPGAAQVERRRSEKTLGVADGAVLLDDTPLLDDERLLDDEWLPDGTWRSDGAWRGSNGLPSSDAEFISPRS